MEHKCNELMEEVTEQMPPDEILTDMAELFKVCGDFVRIKILFSLYAAELCVSDLVSIVGTSQPAVSHQLRILKQARLVKYRREGKTMLYSLADGHVKTIFKQGMEHVEE